MKSAKRPSQLMEGEDSDMPVDASLANQPLQPRPQHLVCGYCLKPGNLQDSHRETYELCFVCESGDHLKSDCLFKKAENIASI